MDALVREEYIRQFCHTNGVLRGPVHFVKFRCKILETYPQWRKQLKAALVKLDREVYSTLCEHFPLDDQGKFLNEELARAHLQRMRPDEQASVITAELKRVCTGNIENARRASLPVAVTNTARVAPAQLLRQESSFGGSVTSMGGGLSLRSRSRDTNDPESTAASSVGTESASENISEIEDLLASKLGQMEATAKRDLSHDDANYHLYAPRRTPNFQLFEQLLVSQNQHMSALPSQVSFERSIRQAPLVGADILLEHHDLVAQYGLLGSLTDEEDIANPQLFLNTNAPFSAFVCGVQGSGKSHTTSCMIENAVLASQSIGYLESPASTLVFSYGEWSGGGAGFNISEATFLGSPNPAFPGHHVKKVTVLYSPSNVAIKRLYERLPNVTMIPFLLKAKTLDIKALHTLMALDEKSTVPLYMATVEAILRDIASKSRDGSMDYTEFKRRLAEENFDSFQTNMLNMRMNLLESFLDLTGNAPEPSFNPGEVTIIDLSDPFVTPSTACILFKLGLEQFLQSRASAKMIVLDETHKYMVDTPGSKIFTEYLSRVIRLQRHQGARVIISTQEPTIATELIALCSVVVMHRFTSPTWYAALKRHINAVDDDKSVMHQIEALETGEALVYSPNAVLGKDEDGNLIKAIGRLLRVNVRARVTLDGGASIMAV